MAKRERGKAFGERGDRSPAIGFVARKGKWVFSTRICSDRIPGSQVSNRSSSTCYAGGWSLASADAQWSVDWTRPQFVNIPRGVQLAKVSKIGGQPIRFLVNPEYNAYSVRGTPHWTFRFGITILAPAKPGK
jgi:hypothetical protein